MVTLEQLVARALDENSRTGVAAAERSTIELVVRATIHGLGFHVAETTGEVCDPRPKPVINYPYDQHGARWAGSGSRRGRGGRR